MSEGFTKLFNSIITSSIWSADDRTRLMWITFLASADPTGYVSGSIPGMAAMARISLPDAEKAISALLAPDPYSRSKEYDGRRLVEVDGGWIILNYTKYREKRDTEERRRQNREAQERWRKRHKTETRKPKVSQDKPQVSPRQKTEDRREGARAKFRKPTPEEVTQYAKSRGYALDGKYFCDTYEARGWMVGRSAMKDWRATVRTWQVKDKETSPKRATAPIVRDSDGLTPADRVMREFNGND